MTRVAFQGERGAFSEDAVVTFFGDVELTPCRSFKHVFEAVSKDGADFGVVPIENSQAGSINETYDLLLKYDLNIYGEIDLRVNHCLMALPGESLKSIITVYSHPQALAQCEQFLSKMGAEIVPTYDTAGSAKLIRDKKLAENIQTIPTNYTKFFAISRQKAKHVAKSKTSLIFATKNVPGALYDCLGAFAKRGINLTKLESRPSKGKPWEYIFYVDLEGHLEDDICKQALADMKKKTSFLKILGSYPKAAEST
jgi:prephenate dehydratase